MTQPQPPQPPAQARTQEGSPDDLLTIPEAADLLKVSAVTISRWRRQGKLQAYKVGPRAVRIRRGDLLDVFAPYRGLEAALPVKGDPLGGRDGPVASAAPAPTGSLEAVPVTPVPVAPASAAPAPDRPVLRRSAIEAAAALRAAILARRGGAQLPAVLDDGSRVRDKRRKRR